MVTFIPKVQRYFAPLDRSAATDGVKRWIIKTGPLPHKTCQSFEYEALEQFGIKLARTMPGNGWHGHLANGQREQLEWLARQYSSPPVVLEFVRPNGLAPIPTTEQKDRPAQLPLPNIGSLRPVDEPAEKIVDAAAFRDNWKRIKALDYSPIPIWRHGQTYKGQRRSKSPCILEWQKHQHAAMTSQEAARALAFNRDADLGICGGYNNVCPIDVDALDPKLQQGILALFPTAPRRIGNPKKLGCLFVRWTGTGPVPSMKLFGKGVTNAEGKIEYPVLVELIGPGRQTVLIGMHPSGAPYYIDGGELPPVSQLPELDDSKLAKLLELLRPHLRDERRPCPNRILGQPGNGSKPHGYISTCPFDRAQVERVFITLGDTPSTISHDPWIKITMAVKALILEGWPPKACRQIHDAWSATAGDMLSESSALKYDPPVVLGQWDSVEAEGRTGVGTLFENDYTGATGAPGEAWARAATKAFCDEWLPGSGPAGLSSPEPNAPAGNPEIVRLAGLLDAGQLEEFGAARKKLLKDWKGVTADVLDKEG